ncbi:hypothetical protein ABT297_27165 [Dactylosporangium sp. NPDC000555]|uniref:hypothetical protein n=1 Tax=Dactylosporangium sp. NPDC000555 TaxID=3154260 RepID=UPI0033181C7E
MNSSTSGGSNVDRDFGSGFDRDPDRDIEDLVRAAQQRRAEPATDPGRLQAALVAIGVRQTRRRRARFAASAAVVLAAVLAVPLAVRGAPHEPGPAEPPPAERVTESPAPSPLTVGTVDLGLRPTWLPSGYTERSRVVEYGGADGVVLTRLWTKGAIVVDSRDRSEPGIKLAITTSASPESDPRPQDGASTVDVNGRPGFYLAAAGAVRLNWRADDRHVLQLEVREAGVGKDDVLRIARSMVADHGWAASALVLGWLPDKHRLLTVSMRGNSPIDWTMFVETARLDSATSPQYLLVAYGKTTTCRDGGEIVGVGTTPGRIVALADNATCLVAGVKPLYLGVTGSWTAGGQPLTNDDLIHVATAVEIVQGWGDTGWIGPP